MKLQLCTLSFWSILILLLFLLTSCDQQVAPVKIGLAINLSGRGGSAGEHIRDGALLAVEEINNSGGINGCPLELLIRDDQNSSEGIRKADQSLIDEGVAVIIGHSTSSNTLISYPIVTSKNTLLISPFAATDKLTGKDDFFLRTQVSCELYGKKAAKLVEKAAVSSVVLLLDVSNAGFVVDWANSFKRHFGGRSTEVKFNSRKEVNWSKLTDELLEQHPEEIIMLTEASMTGVGLQKLKTAGYEGAFIASIWAHTSGLMRYAGTAAEGLSIVTFIDSENSRPAYVNFSKKMEKYFMKKANPRSTRAYEIVYILADALRRCSSINSDELKVALLAEEYDTLMGHVKFDAYGDVVRPVYEIVVRDNEFRNNGEI